MHLPDPVMLTAATLVKDSGDLAGDIEEEEAKYCDESYSKIAE